MIWLPLALGETEKQGHRSLPSQSLWGELLLWLTFHLNFPLLSKFSLMGFYKENKSIWTIASFCWEGEKIYCIRAIDLQGPFKISLVQSLNLQKIKLRPRKGKWLVQGHTERSRVWAQTFTWWFFDSEARALQAEDKVGAKAQGLARSHPAGLNSDISFPNKSICSVSEVCVPTCNYLLYGATSFFYALSLWRQGPDLQCRAHSSQGVTAE